MNKYKFYNNLLGWVVFAIALITYLLTIEPTASWWDCGEFIASAFKLEVGHPPGAPLFSILARVFTLFAGSNLAKVALMVNTLSAITSAFTILFLFWTITSLCRKFILTEKETSISNMIIVLGSGMVGALAFTFSDSFWFSAVEGEVYASSSFFTAIVFWAILKWESHSEKHGADRWIILIAYLMGLSIGVHLLNLLAIPAITFVYYFKRYKTTRMGLLKTTALSVLILGFVQYGIIPGLVYMASRFELQFVNNLKMGFGSGIIIYTLLLLGLLVFGIYYSQKKHKVILNTALLSLFFVVIGYTSYAMIVIRSNANPPLNENSPDNVFSLKSYLDREQYGDRPLFYGQYFTAKITGQKEGETYYNKGKSQYEPAGKKAIPIYDANNCGIFPRMHSNDPQHIRAYKYWTNTTGDHCPTFAENLSFLFNYQLGYMYFRYFMWNFAGRQNDEQGHGFKSNFSHDLTNGNWISGIPFIDSRLGPQDNLPDSIKNNKTRNTFYMLPLILGLLGLFIHFKKAKKDASIVMILFVMTGIAIVLYLNQTPFQPRERDYSYAGSFYAFAIWIGMGVSAIWSFFSAKLKRASTALIITLACLLLVPGIMAKEGWDDHDRSGRYTTRDFAYNYLTSCEPNAILVTNGDNDTFPLWYEQEVENVRTDVRVLNYALSAGAWYSRQLHQKIYASDKMPYTLSTEQYKQGTNDYIPIIDKGIEGYTELKDLISFVASDNPDTKVATEEGETLSFFPTNKLKITTDPVAASIKGYIPKNLIDSIVSPMEWELGKSYIYKHELLLLDLIATNQWERPLYFVYPGSIRSIMSIEKYCSLEGYIMRFLPVNAPNYIQGLGGMNVEKTYDLYMNKFRWGRIGEPDVFVDKESYRNVITYRNKFALLAQTLLIQNKNDSALKILNKSLQIFPISKIPGDLYTLAYIQLYYQLGQKDKAIQLANEISKYYSENYSYFDSFKGEKAASVAYEKNQALQILQNIEKIKQDYGQQKTQ